MLNELLNAQWSDLNERIIEFELRWPGPWPHIYSYNWLISWQNKNVYAKIVESVII